MAIFVGKNKGGDIMNNYFKPTLKNLSQGARLEYVRKLRYNSYLSSFSLCTLSL